MRSRPVSGLTPNRRQNCVVVSLKPGISRYSPRTRVTSASRAGSNGCQDLRGHLTHLLPDPTPGPSAPPRARAAWPPHGRPIGPAPASLARSASSHVAPVV